MAFLNKHLVTLAFMQATSNECMQPLMHALNNAHSSWLILQAVGNHEFDNGPDKLAVFAAALKTPLVR